MLGIHMAQDYWVFVTIVRLLGCCLTGIAHDVRKYLRKYLQIEFHFQRAGKGLAKILDKISVHKASFMITTPYNKPGTWKAPGFGAPIYVHHMYGHLLIGGQRRAGRRSFIAARLERTHLAFGAHIYMCAYMGTLIICGHLITHGICSAP